MSQVINAKSMLLIVFLVCFCALAFTWWLALWVLGKSDGPAGMRDVASAIRQGAEGFLATQYSAISRYAIVMAGVIYLLYLTKPAPLAGAEVRFVASTSPAHELAATTNVGTAWHLRRRMV